MKNKNSFFALAIAFGMVFVSCDPPPAETETEEPKQEVEVIEEDPGEANEFLYTLPSPLQIASIFRRSGLDYIPNLTNSPDNVSKYNTKLSQKLNFGVYTADLAYSSLNNQNQACIDYVKVIGNLSESLWMTNIFSSVSILQRFESNLGNTDSLGYIISDFQMELDSYLEENGLSTNSLLIFTGAWAESMYLAFNSLEAAPNAKLLGRLIEQKKISESLIEKLEAENDEDPEMAALIEQLKAVDMHFKDFQTDDLEDESALEQFEMSDEARKAALEDIVAMRNLIVNG